MVGFLDKILEIFIDNIFDFQQMRDFGHDVLNFQIKIPQRSSFELMESFGSQVILVKIFHPYDPILSELLI